MTRVLVVADCGRVHRSLTAAVEGVRGAYIAGYANTRTSVGRLVAQIAPDLVVIGDMSLPSDVLLRLTEIRGAAPRARAVVVTSVGPEASWLADVLDARACAVIAGEVEPWALAGVLGEVIAERNRAAADAPASDIPKRTSLTRHEGRRRMRRLETARSETVA